MLIILLIILMFLMLEPWDFFEISTVYLGEYTYITLIFWLSIILWFIKQNTVLFKRVITYN